MLAWRDGGAEPRLETSGLIGLHDRIGALKGATQVSSPASPARRYAPGYAGLC
jgi:hypothetical protein